MKKFLALLLALVMVLSLTACGAPADGGEAGEEAESNGTAAQDDTERVELYREDVTDHPLGLIASGAYAIYTPNGEDQRPNIEVYSFYDYDDAADIPDRETLEYQYTPTYDEQGTLIKEELMRLGYDEGGNSEQEYVEVNTYNPDGSYTRTVTKQATGELRETYTFDSAGLMTRWEYNSGAWYECSYDEQGHAVSERAFSTGKTWPGESHIDYSYDASANTSAGTYHTSFVPDAGGTYASTDDVAISYDEDARVTKKTNNDRVEVECEYSDDGRISCTRKWEGDYVTSYTHDESGVFAVTKSGSEGENDVIFFDVANNAFGLYSTNSCNNRGIVDFGTITGRFD